MDGSHLLSVQVSASMEVGAILKVTVWAHLAYLRYASKNGRNMAVSYILPTSLKLPHMMTMHTNATEIRKL